MKKTIVAVLLICSTAMADPATPPIFMTKGSIFTLQPSAAGANKTPAINAAGTAWEMRDVSNAGLLTSGTLPDGRFPSALPAVSGANLTGLIFSQFSSGSLTLARGGTQADLSATGGTNRVLMQLSSGAAVTVSQLASGSLSDSSNIAKIGSANIFTARQQIGFTSTSSNGKPEGLIINNDYQLSGTAASSDIFINRLEDSLGSGTNNFAEFQVNGTTLLSLTNVGGGTFAGQVAAATFSGNGSGLTNIPNSALNASSLSSPNTLFLRDSNSSGAVGTLTLTRGLLVNAGTTTSGAIRVRDQADNTDVLNISTTGAGTFAGALNATNGTFSGTVSAATFSGSGLSLTGVGLLASANTWTNSNSFARGTITTSDPFTISQTWNTSTITFNGILLNITDTLSTATSTFADFQVGGVSKFKVDKTGAATFASSVGWNGGGILKTNGAVSTSVGFERTTLASYGGGGNGASVVNSTGVHQWTNSGAYTGTVDTGLARNAAGVVEANNGTKGTLGGFTSATLTTSGAATFGGSVNVTGNGTFSGTVGAATLSGAHSGTALGLTKIAKRRSSRWAASGSTTTLGNLGDAPTGVGTTPTANAASSTEMPGLRYDAQDSGDGTTVVIGGVGGSANYIYGKNVRYTGNFKFGVITNVRYWICLTSDTAANQAASDNLASSNVVGFRFSTIASDATIKAITRDGSTQTVTNTGITPDTNWHSFDIICDDTAANAVFYIDGAVVATVTLTRPTTNSILRQCFTSCNNPATANSQHNYIYLSELDVEEDWK